MENRRNYYRILHVQPGAPAEIIRASYRTLMQRLRAHPDLGGDHWNATLINEAYAVLTDAARRAEYDRGFKARVLDARHGPAGAPAAPAAAATRRCPFCSTPHRSRSNARAPAACRACGSPLHRAMPGAPGADGRRAVQRLPRDYPLTLYTRWPQPQGLAARSRDVSPAGISFVTAELLDPRAVVKVDSDLCRAIVQVANLRPDPATQGWLVGARFLSVAFPRLRGAFLSTQA